MRKRTAATGAGVAGLAALGLMYLPDWDFGSLGVPSGGGDDITQVTLDPTSPTNADEIEPAPRFDGDTGDGGDGVATPAVGETVASPGADPMEADAPLLAVVDVTVDGGEYLVIRGSAVDGLPRREGMPLAEVLKLASQVPGAPDGVKIRIFRTGDAIAGAVSDLQAGLSAAGFQNDEIDFRSTLVETGPNGLPADGGYPGEGGDGGARPSDMTP